MEPDRKKALLFDTKTLLLDALAAFCKHRALLELVSTDEDEGAKLYTWGTLFERLQEAAMFGVDSDGNPDAHALSTLTGLHADIQDYQLSWKAVPGLDTNTLLTKAVDEVGVALTSLKYASEKFTAYQKGQSQ